MTELASGSVVICELEPAKGSEMKKRRPVVVLEPGLHSRLGLFIAVPVTEGKGKGPPAFVPIPEAELSTAGLSKSSVVNPYQIRCMSRERIVEHSGTVSEGVLSAIKRYLVLVLDIHEEHFELWPTY